MGVLKLSVTKYLQKIAKVGNPADRDKLAASYSCVIEEKSFDSNEYFDDDYF